jgi:hypothetical protein
MFVDWCSYFVLPLLDLSFYFLVFYVTPFMLFFLRCSFRIAPHIVTPRVTPPIVPFTLTLFLHNRSSHVGAFALQLLHYSFCAITSTTIILVFSNREFW